MIGIAFAALNVNHEPAPDPERLDQAAAEAQARVIEEIEEWEIADEEGGDGGEAVRLLSHEEMIDKRTFDQGMKKAYRAEDRREKNYARNARGGAKDGAFKNGRTNEGLREINFHTANEQTLRKLGDPKIGALNGKKVENKKDPRAQNTSDTDHETGGGVPILESGTAARLAALDEIDDYFTI